MFADPQSLTIGGTAVSFPRTSSSDGKGVYTPSTLDRVLTLQSTQTANRARRISRLQRSKVAPDALFPAQNRPYDLTVSVLVNVPLFGFTTTEVVNEASGLLSWLTATSNANLTKLVGGEN